MTAQGRIFASGHYSIAVVGARAAARPWLATRRTDARAVVMQRKTQRPVQFVITPLTRDAVGAWVRHAGLKTEDYLFPSRVHRLPRT